MSDERFYEELPSDPEQAFLLLEGKFRNECERKVNSASQDDSHVFYADYIAQVLAAITALGLDASFEGRLPRIEDVNYSTYLNFSKDVKHYRTILEIQHARRVQGFSVRFDAVTKQKIKHHLLQVRDIVDKLEIDQNKKEALFNKIGALEQEIDRDRTRLEAYGALIIESSGILGEAAGQLEPVRKWLDTIGRLIWGAKKEEETKQLLPPDKRKLIEPPRSSPPPGTPGDLDDEIPF